MSNAASSVSTVVFDVGNVLLDWNPRHLYRKMFADEAAMERFLADVCTAEWNLELDRGLAFAEAVAERIKRFPEFAAEIRAYDERWREMVDGAIEGSVTLLERLAQRGVPLYAITNFSAEKFAESYERFAFFELFRGVVVSGRVKLLKPDPAIYRLLLDAHDLDADACLFIDDSAANIEAARRLGFRTVLFESPQQLEENLTAFGLL